MRWLAAIAVLGMIGLAAPAAAAGSRKVLVLPVDGALDAQTRSRLTADVARLARALDGQIATGSATFADTALAVGCDPQAAGCADEVMATLGVDELVWSTATRSGGHTRLVVRRAARGGVAREAATTFSTSDRSPGRSDRIASEIAPLFGPEAAPAAGSGGGAASGGGAPGPRVAQGTAGAASAPGTSGEDPAIAPPAPLGTPAPAAASSATVSPEPGPADGRSNRTTGIALTAGGGIAVVLGLALWASYASLQDAIDHHDLDTPADFRDLRDLEDRAQTRAIAGNVFVISGLIVGGIGAYVLYRDHRRHAVSIAPAPVAGGMAVIVRGTL